MVAKRNFYRSCKIADYKVLRSVIRHSTNDFRASLICGFSIENFRMKESTAQFFTHEQYGEILSLSTDERDIFTLEDYNRAMQADNAQGWPVWFMIEGGLLVLLLYFTWKLKKEKL